MKLDLETLKYVKDVFNLHSDTSCLTNGYKNLLELIKQEESKQLTLTDVSNSLADEEYEPYFGWCDVDGCENEGCSGGNAWRNTGYWTVCYKNSDDHRKGLEQPKMKQTAIERERKRDKKTGYLSQ